jgi:hypothetical protein
VLACEGLHQHAREALSELRAEALARRWAPLRASDCEHVLEQELGPALRLFRHPHTHHPRPEYRLKNGVSRSLKRSAGT